MAALFPRLRAKLSSCLDDIDESIAQTTCYTDWATVYANKTGSMWEQMEHLLDKAAPNETQDLIYEFKQQVETQTAYRTNPSTTDVYGQTVAPEPFWNTGRSRRHRDPIWTKTGELRPLGDGGLTEDETCELDTLAALIPLMKRVNYHYHMSQVANGNIRHEYAEKNLHKRFPKLRQRLINSPEQADAFFDVFFSENGYHNKRASWTPKNIFL